VPRRGQLPPFEALPLGRCREPFEHREWVYEVKLDGFRALAHVRPGEAVLVSRNGHVYRARAFEPLRRELATALRARSAVLDGELVCVDDEGRSVFLPLLYRRGEPCFFAFDLLALDGRDLRARPLLERKRLLRRVLRRRRDARVRYLEHVARRGVELFRLACELDLEGIVAKWKDAPYRLEGDVSPWVKIKNGAYSQARDRHELFDGFRRRSA
jgi:bifunctional non-homologous end joining protein LigD